MAQTILYYPQINVQDETWLKSAILYWDQVASIVPYKEYEYFSPEISYLQNLGVYSAINPKGLFFSEYAEDFYKTVTKRISAYDKRLSASKTKMNNCRQVRIHKSKIQAPLLHEMIHYGKFPQDLLTYFKDKRFVNDHNNDGWMEIDSRIAQIYMKTLAEYLILCSDQDMVLGTDTVTHNREIYCSNVRKEQQTQCCIINIKKCLPQPSTDANYEDILHFKERRKDELYAFRTKIRELETNIYHAESQAQINHYEEQFRESIEKCSSEYYRVLHEAGIPFVLSSLTSLVAIPFVSDMLSHRFGPDFSTIIQAGAQILNIGIGYCNYRDRISPHKSDGGFSYIIKAKKERMIQI